MFVLKYSHPLAQGQSYSGTLLGAETIQAIWYLDVPLLKSMQKTRKKQNEIFKEINRQYLEQFCGMNQNL
jgi:hypothetical protein